MQFGPERRVRKRVEFQSIQRSGRRSVSTNFVFVVAPAAAPEAPPRLGITVTRRVGNAVRRSRIKRIVRAAFQIKDGLVPPGFDLVVICRHDNPTLKTEDVIAQFLKSTQNRKKQRDTRS